MITITTPATEFKLISVAAAKAATEIAAADNLVGDFVDRASDVIARHCNRVFALETVTEHFRLNELRAEIILARYPVVEITSIVSDNGTTLTVSDYEVDKAKGIITRLYNDRACYWSACKSTIVYSAGYDLPDAAPDALQQAAIHLVKAYWHARTRDPALRSEDVPALASMSYLDIEHLPHDVRGMLVPFRNLRVR